MERPSYLRRDNMRKRQISRIPTQKQKRRVNKQAQIGGHRIVVLMRIPEAMMLVKSSLSPIPYEGRKLANMLELLLFDGFDSLQFAVSKTWKRPACFTNLSRVTTLKCHHDAIEKMRDLEHPH
ncbi:hypothetical protein OSB04_013366 [Centaurea solstitialis]|uniref:Uncharacterized protein n=1 Tax=Centaurea solstitialis TaxID=347529 RepID=A0AA38WFF6_9ASTR|nr:hypothetical protein OSB04_013366 [Centaurea solstitialis]